MPVRHFSRLQLPRALAAPVAVSKVGVPRYWASVYALRNWSDLAPSSIRKKLRAIEGLYSFADNFLERDTLDRMIADMATDGLDRLLEAYFNAERNKAVRSGADVGRCWRIVREFVLETLRDLAHTAEDQSKLIELTSQLRRWELRYRNLSPNPLPKRIHVLRALPARVIEELYTLFRPDSPDNPFRSEPQRWRNMAILLCLLHQGLRRSEALLLTADAVKTGTDERTLKPRYWMNVHNQFEDEDPRYCDPPAIKNSQSIRQIPVSREVAEYIDAYVTNYRGRSPHPQLSRRNRAAGPKARKAIGRIISQAKLALSLAPQT